MYVMKEEKLYCIWIAFVCFFGLMNIWAGLLLWQFDSIVKSLREGIVYTYSISICAPFLVLCGTFSSFFAFYMYCVAQMERHKELLGEFDDHEYKSCHSSGTVIEDVRTEMKT